MTARPALGQQTTTHRPTMSDEVETDRVTDIYRRIQVSGRTEIFTHLRPATDVLADHEASVAGGGELAGVLLAVKDNVDVAGLPTTAACPSFGSVAAEDAPAVAALRAAGAVVIGKTNLDQFATGLVGTRSPFGAVRDSRRMSHISGGSSSGSAVAVALGFADIAIGTDTAGSGRVPAALQGIVGIKPTIGVVSTAGVVPACASYDCVTVFAADVPSANTAMGVMARAPGDRPFGSDTAFAAGPTPVIAVPRELPGLDARWQRAFAAAVSHAESAGMRIRSIDLTDFLDAAAVLYDGALVAERYDAVGDVVRAGAPDLDPTVAAIITAADRWSAVELLADRRRVAALRASASAQLDGVDALMVPTVPAHPTITEVDTAPVTTNSLMGTYTNFCNLFDLCAIAIPAGIVDEGARGIAQFGVSLLSTAHRDAVLLDIAARLTGDRSTTTWPEPAGAATTELAVFGAHLRGQPLEHQLTDLGARWAGEIATAPSYRLVALDTRPAKPGLVPDSAGRSIRGEKWVLSPAALGRFLTALPDPMTLGAITLDDGSTITGFSCHQEALTTATDLEVDHWLLR